MSTDCNRADDFLFSQQQESTSGANKYEGLVPKKKPLISKDSKRAFFDSADWALLKSRAYLYNFETFAYGTKFCRKFRKLYLLIVQEASIDQRPIAAIEKLRPKFQRTPRKQLPPRRPTCATGHDNLTESSF